MNYMQLMGAKKTPKKCSKYKGHNFIDVNTWKQCTDCDIIAWFEAIEGNFGETRYAILDNGKFTPIDWSDIYAQ